MNSPAATLKLEYPVSVGKGDPVYELSFRRLRASDFKKLPDDDGDQQIALLARITSQPRSTIEELDGADFKAAGEIMKGFLKSSRPTGEQSSGGSPTE